MTDLIVKFDCANAEDRAQEFQDHLIDRKIVRARVQSEAQGGQTWLSFPNVQNDTIRRIITESHPWCLDRGLGLMQNSSAAEGSQTTTLLIADLTRIVE
jgi:hypothetical protein